MKTIIAALGYLYQGDYSIPLHVLDELKDKKIDIVDLSLGAIKAASLLSILAPERLIILSCNKKGKKELRIYSPDLDEDQISSWMDLYSNLRAYNMDLESFLKAANSLNVLPKDTIVIECEVELENGISLSSWGKECKELMIRELEKLLGNSIPISENKEKIN